jgi:hypothetical protein
MDGGNNFSWDGKSLAWKEGGYVWDVSGQFKGEIKQINGHYYVLKNMYALPPLPKMPKLNPLPVISIPAPQPIVPPIVLDIGWTDGL